MLRDLTVIVGLGATGMSCARYLHKKGLPFAVTDSRPLPPNLDEFKILFPDAILSTGQIDPSLLERAIQLIVSPGISLNLPVIAEQIAKGVKVIGDIELFAQAAHSPIIAITGTNAKSTVTTLVGEMIATAGFKVGVGGNLGVPALDLLSKPEPDFYVLELSSFQLESTYSLAPAVATVLNVTPDHMDRYNSLEHYSSTKQRVYQNCQVAVCNKDDVLTFCNDSIVCKKLYFTLNEPGDNEFGLLKKGDEIYLVFQTQLLLPVSDLPILGRHYQANALAALAIGYGVGLPFSSMLKTLVEFKGLPHRCQLVREKDGTHWYNDSKGTNVGASLAAIEGLGAVIKGRLILIAGGVSKNADFSSLIPAMEKYVKTVVLIGEAAPILAQTIGGRVDIRFAGGMEEAVVIAHEMAEANDCVLLSPACASFDMFNNFEHRGEVFVEKVNGL